MFKNKNKKKILTSIKYFFIILISLTVIYTVAKAGDLNPSASPASSMHSLLEMAAKDASDTFDRTTDSLEAISEAISGLVANVWDKATSELTSSGSIGKLLVDNVDTSISSRAPSSTALISDTWTDSRAESMDFLNSDLKFLVSSSTASTTPFSGSLAYLISSSTTATSTDTLFGWFKHLYDYTAPSSTALSENTWTDDRAESLDAINSSGYSSTTIAADIDGNILERLEYLNNRNMFSVVNLKNGSAGANVADSAFYTQAKGGVDDYNNNGTMPTDSFTASWTECTAGNNYCRTGDDNADYQDDNTGLVWSDYLDSGTDHNWWWANNCHQPGSWANPGSCSSDGDDACQCVKATSTPDMTGCEDLGDGGWRLPYQKELMQAYIDGSWGNLSHAGYTFWSATTLSSYTRLAWRVYLHNGNTGYTTKINTYDARCVR